MTRLFTAFAMLFCFASRALAHGGPPAIENVLASDADGPWLIELSEGFALRSSTDSWSFVCPALFGSDLPPLSATLAGEAWVAGGMDLFRLSQAPSLIATDRPDLAGPHVLSLAALDGGLIALRIAPASSTASTQLVRLRDDELQTLFESSVFWSALAVQPASQSASNNENAELWLARIDGTGLELVELSADGQELRRQPIVLLAAPNALRLSVAGEHVFAHVFDNAGYTLLHVATRGEPALQAEVVVQAMLPVRGPVLRGDEVLLTRDEELMRWIPGSIELSNSPLGTLPLTCLTDDYACTRSLLFESDRVEQAGVLDPELALFDLAELEDPTLYSADPELGEYCTAQWLVFQADLMRAGITDGDGGLAMPGSDAGLDSGFESADAGDAATTEDAALDTDSGHDDAGVARATHSDGCSAVRIAQHASELKSAWLSLGLCAAAIYLRRRLAHARRAW